MRFSNNSLVRRRSVRNFIGRSNSVRSSNATDDLPHIISHQRKPYCIIMLPDQEALVKGVQIHRRINELSKVLVERSFPQERVVLSPELYFALLEYTVLMNETNMNRDLLLWELFQRDELFFDTGSCQLKITIDFFVEPNTISIH